jgi:hypothetical protein
MGRIKYQEAIGLEVKRGRPPFMPTPKMKEKLTRLYVKKGRSGAEFGELKRIFEREYERPKNNLSCGHFSDDFCGLPPLSE